MTWFTTEISAADAAKILMMILDRDIVKIKSDNDTESVIVGRTRSDRYIGLLRQSDGTLLLGISENMLASENFWREIFGNFPKDRFDIDDEHDLRIPDYVCNRIIDNSDSYSCSWDETFRKQLYSDCCGALGLRPANVDADLALWSQRLAPIREYVGDILFSNVLREEYFKLGGSLQSAIRHLAEVNVDSVISAWSVACGLPDPRQKPRARRITEAPESQPVKKGAPRRPKRSTK